MPDRVFLVVHDGQTCVERVGCWDPMGVVHAKGGILRYSFLEWVAKILSGSIDVDDETATRDSGGLLGY